MKQDFEAIGARLAMLLEVANIPEDQKEAWATLIPEMTLAQIDQLTEYLSLTIPDQSKEDMSALIEKLKSIQVEHDSAVTEQQEKTLNALDQIEAEIN